MFPHELLVVLHFFFLLLETEPMFSQLQRNMPSFLKSSALAQRLDNWGVGGNGITLAFRECELVFP